MIPTVSVVVPVYNVRNYVKRAVKSVCEQSYKKLEIIIIDDGSTDGSEKICKSIAEKDTRIKYFRTKNMGLSHARNMGINVAIGKYLYFMDSDDYIEKEVIKRCLETIEIEGVDVALIKQKQISAINQRKRNPYPLMDKISEVISNINAVQLLYEDKLSVTSWSYMTYKRLYTDNELFFEEGRLHEDLGVTPQIFYLSKSVSIVSGNYTSYHYYERKGSIMSVLKEKNILDNNYMLDKNKYFFSDKNSRILKTIEKKALRYNIELLLNINPLDLRKNKEIYYYIRDKISCIDILKYNLGVKLLFKYLISRMPFLKIITFNIFRKDFISLK